MNNKGQTLVLFIILIPIFIIIMAFIIDIGTVINKKLEIENKLTNKKVSEVEKTLLLNNIKTKSITYSSNCVIIISSVEGVFGNIVNKELYEIEIKKCE